MIEQSMTLRTRPGEVGLAVTGSGEFWGAVTELNNDGTTTRTIIIPVGNLPALIGQLSYAAIEAALMADTQPREALPQNIIMLPNKNGAQS